MYKEIYLGNKFSIANYKSAINEIVEFFKEVHGIEINQDDIEFHTKTELQYTKDWDTGDNILSGVIVKYYVFYGF